MLACSAVKRSTKLHILYGLFDINSRCKRLCRQASNVSIHAAHQKSVVYALIWFHDIVLLPLALRQCLCIVLRSTTELHIIIRCARNPLEMQTFVQAGNE